MSIYLKNVTVNTSLVEASVANEMPTRKYENFVAEIWNLKTEEYLALAICHSDNWRDIELRTRSRIASIALNQFSVSKGWLRERVGDAVEVFINDSHFVTRNHKTPHLTV